jgi:hypothetical protein
MTNKLTKADEKELELHNRRVLALAMDVYAREVDTSTTPEGQQRCAKLCLSAAEAFYDAAAQEEYVR